MKVFEQAGGGITPGSTLSLAELGLPLTGGGAALIVFWKRQ